MTNNELTVVMDSNYWINFEDHPARCEEFREAKDRNGFSVTYTRANFVDMANTDQQDSLSPMIADTADAYMAVDTYNSGEYHRDEDPIVLARPEFRNEFQRRTAGLDDGQTLKFLFRNIDQAPEEAAATLAQQIKEVYDEHGRSRAELCAFGTKVRRDEDAGGDYEASLYVDWDAVHDMEFVRKMLVVEHAAQIQDGENVGTQDYVDMEVCAHAIFEGDVTFIEEKWADHGIIQRVCDLHQGVNPPVVVSSHGALLDALADSDALLEEEDG